MRDAVFNRLYELAQKDKNLMIVTADMGAPALDKFRADFPDQFLDVGIAEQAMVAVAAGLVLSGKRVFTYAIAAFAVSRCYEALKVNFAFTGLPLTVIGVGSGTTYWESGPTHHAVDDVPLMQLLGATIYEPMDDETAAEMTSLAYHQKGLTYLRLPRGDKVQHVLTPHTAEIRFTKKVLARI